VFGRRLIHATLEHQRPVFRLADGALGVAAFIDAARAWHRLEPGGQWHADVGLGARLALPAGAGTLRLDVARGLRDRRHVVSAGWLTAWPDR
jgi:outer membrane translocation and assembly module TamA